MLLLFLSTVDSFIFCEIFLSTTVQTTHKVLVRGGVQEPKFEAKDSKNFEGKDRLFDMGFLYRNGWGQGQFFQESFCNLWSANFHFF